MEKAEPEAPEPPAPPQLPLGLVLKACPDLLTSWRYLIATASEGRGMMGISASAWDEAQSFMGPETAAITVSAMLQHAGSISNPGGYLRALSAKAASTGSTPGPMIMALLNCRTGKAA